MTDPNYKGNAPPPYPGMDPSQQQQPPPGYVQAEFQQGGQGNIYPQVPPPQGYPPQPTGYYPQGQQPLMSGPGGPVTVITVSPLGPYPASMTCPKCQNQIVTTVNPAPGILTWLICGGLVFFGCWFGCCLIPFCVPECQDIEHICPNCKGLVGIYKRI